MRLAEEAGQHVFRTRDSIQGFMEFPRTLTPDEGVILLFLGLLTLLACLGFAIWLVVS